MLQSFFQIEIGGKRFEFNLGLFTYASARLCRKLFANIDFSGAGPLSLAEEARLKKREQNSDSQFIV
jgi:hypothetical protein